MRFEYKWRWHLPGSPERLWPLVSDTDRFNRETGLPVLEEIEATGEGLENARRRLRFRRLGFVVEWEETPFEWVRPWRFGVVRRYTRGPLSEMRVLVRLEPADGGTLLRYDVVASTANVLGIMAIPIQIGLLSRVLFGRVFRRWAQRADADQPAGPLPLAGVTPALAPLRTRLTAAGVEERLARGLVQFVGRGDPMSLNRIRPYALAELWQAPRRAVLEACMHATREGILELRWGLLCPLCRGEKDTVASLSELRAEDRHCDVCLVDFTVDLDQSVELYFRPNPRYRAVESSAFCVAGPQVTPHVVVQQLVPAGEERVLEPLLEPGRHRLRALGVPGGRSFQVETGQAQECSWWLEGGVWNGHAEPVAEAPRVSLRNADGVERVFVLERLAWADDVVTAAEATSLQTFRDVFSSEVLARGDFLSVQTVAVAFTDLRASTALYRRLGDAPAFGKVMGHFEVVERAVAAEEGAVVKTIGDAVMAVFRSPVQAMRAMEAAHLGVAADAEPGESPLRLKAAVHVGPCLLVTLNDRLDYFGSTVNVAARLSEASTGGDVVFSATVREDIEVAEWLAGHNRPEPFRSVIRGLEKEMELYRLEVVP